MLEVFWTLYFIFGICLVFKFFYSILINPTDEEKEMYSLHIYYVKEHPFISALLAILFIIISPVILVGGYIFLKVREANDRKEINHERT